MIYQEVSWLRSVGHKLDPLLRQQCLRWYRPARYAPCFTQRLVRGFRTRWRRIPVIVQLESPPEAVTSLNLVAAAAGCKVKRELKLINAFATDVNAAALRKLALNAEVSKIYYDGEVKAVLDTASPTVGAPALWGNGLTGRGVGIAILDTGIYNHPDLARRIVGFKDFIANKEQAYDDNGHGTHVAGDAAGNGSQSDGFYRAPAPEAVLVGVKVLNKVGSGSLSTVIAGVEWCLNHREKLGIRVINLSLGSEARLSHREDPVCQAVEAVWQAGLVVCVAAGNSGPEPRTVNSPGTSPLVITVGASDDAGTPGTGDDTIASFSSRGPTPDGLTKPDLVAPGVNVVSLRSPGSFLDKQAKQGRVGQWYTSLSGTSMATPVCAGVVAQLLQLNNSLSPDEIKSILMSSARDLGLDPNTQGSGLVNAEEAAVEAAVP
jgi:serine protease AprX